MAQKYQFSVPVTQMQISKAQMQPSTAQTHPTTTQIQSNIKPSDSSHKSESTDNENQTIDKYYIDKIRKENLLKTIKDLRQKEMYLLEIFINDLEITKENNLMSLDIESLPPLRVRVKFATIPCFDIYEEHILFSSPSSGKVVSLGNDEESVSESGTYKSGQWHSSYGKSCLFTMIPIELIHNIQSFPMTLKVYRTTDDNYELPASYVGHTRIKLEDELVNCVLRAGDMKTEFPVSSYQSHFYTIHNLVGEKTGKIDIFIRLSCFRNMISTQFQSLNYGQEYVFKHYPGKHQSVSTVDNDLPEDYKPPKWLGKTDLVPCQPIFVTEDLLFGVGRHNSQKPNLKDIEPVSIN